MRIDQQHVPAKIPAGESHLPQRDLQTLSVFDRVRSEQLVDRGVAGHERQTVGEFEAAAIGQRAIVANSAHAQRRLLDHLHREPRFDVFARTARPAAQQIPGSESEMFGRQQPHSDKMTADLVRQELSHVAFHARRIRAPSTSTQTRVASLERRFSVSGVSHRPQSMKFFFEARSPPRLVPRCEC